MRSNVNLTGISAGRSDETLQMRLVRILREFDRKVPLDLLARIAEAREDEVDTEVNQLVRAKKAGRDTESMIWLADR